MDVFNLPYSLDIANTTGNTLNPEEIYKVQNALIVLQHENHFKQIFFWGKIFGIDKDYYLAFGFRSDVVKGRVFYYSTNQMDWFLLSSPTPAVVKLAPQISQRFQGDPSYVSDCNQAITSEPHDNNCSGGSAKHRLKEEDRLAGVVRAITDDCAIAPKGGLFETEGGRLEPNPFFQGLDSDQGSTLDWWVHLRSGDRPDQELSKGSLTSAADDIASQGAWSMRVRAHGSVCIARSLMWLGLTAYHRLRTREHGFVYLGSGIKNDCLISTTVKL